MNFYHALNQGDASLKEAHLTSMLYYLFKETSKTGEGKSLLHYFFRSFLPDLEHLLTIEFDIETQIRIEEILSTDEKRRDTDITIYINNALSNRVINIENKIAYNSVQPGQINDQNRLLELKNPTSQVISLMILPFPIDSFKPVSSDAMIIYWTGTDNSLINILCRYFEENTLIDVGNGTVVSLLNWKNFFEAFAEQLEQERLSKENLPRGAKVRYRKTMFAYLSDIASNWNLHFPNPEDVRVGDLLDKFDEIVVKDLMQDYDNGAKTEIEKFRKGALLAQPKIVTINDKNRIHFNITDGSEKENYLIFWKDKSNCELQFKSYKRFS